MSCAPDYTTKLNAAAPAAGVVIARAWAAMRVGFTTEFGTGPKPPLAVRRRR